MEDIIEEELFDSSTLDRGTLRSLSFKMLAAVKVY